MIFHIGKRMRAAFLVRSILVCLLFLSLFATGLIAVSAQTIPDDATSDQSPFTFSTDPLYPRANQRVTVSIESYTYDLNRSAIRWYVNGKQQKQGTAEKSITIQTGPLGSRSSVRAIVVSPDGRIADQTYVIIPAEIELVWQANTYTPPFYKGKAIFTNQSDVRVIAIPTLSGYSAKNLIYTWRKDGQIIEGGGTLGKDSIVITGGLILRPFNILVEVESSDGMVHASNDVTFTPDFPVIRAYQNHPTRGILFSQALASAQNVGGADFSVTAIPFFFSTPNPLASNAPITWSVNGVSDDNTRGKPTITIQKTAGGSATIGIAATHTSKPFQTMKTSFDINFAQ